MNLIMKFKYILEELKLSYRPYYTKRSKIRLDVMSIAERIWQIVVHFYSPI